LSLEGGGLPLRRFLVEGAVIVASILLAFAVDAAWERRGEAAEREALLAALEQDLIAVEAEMDRVEIARSTSEAAAEEVVARAQYGTLGEIGDVELGVLVWHLTFTASFDAPLGSVEALLSGGNLEVLHDPVLARLLTALPAAVADMDREQVRGIAYADGYLMRLAEQGVSLANMPDPTQELPWPVRPEGLAPHLADPELVSHATNLWYSHREVVAELADVREIVDSIRVRIAGR
jgi:hypothetical protein